MKTFTRIVSAILLLCIVLILLPSFNFAKAAGVQYILDTDGTLDLGAEYLIVKGTKPWGASDDQTTYYALCGADHNKPTAGKQVTLAGDFLTSFDGIEDYLWTIEDLGNDTYGLKHSNQYLSLNPFQHSQNQVPFKLIPTSSNQFIIFQEDGDQGYYLSYNLSMGTFVNSKNYSSHATGVYFFKKVSTGNSITFHGNGNTAGSVPKSETLNPGSSYTIPDAPKDFAKEDYKFSHWNDQADGTGTNYFPGNAITVNQDLELYAQWTPNYLVSVATKLNGIYTDIGTMVSGANGLVIRPDGEGSTYLPLTRTEAGLYTTTLTENGTYSVYFVKTGGYLDTGTNIVIDNKGGTAELAYFSVSYNPNGGELDKPIAEVIYPAGTRVVASGSKPTQAGLDFLGWMDQKGNIIQPDGVITESLQERTILSAYWSQPQPTSYTIRYLVQGTYAQLLPNVTVDGTVSGMTVIANQQSTNIDGYTYVGAGIGGQFYEKERDPYMTLSADASKNVLILFYKNDPDLHLDKEAILEDDGTYTIELDMFTHDNPITTLVEEKIPLDIVLVLDQSGSMFESKAYLDLRESVTLFINEIANHGRTNQVDHRLAIVGYGSTTETGSSGNGPIAGNFKNDQTNTDPNIEGSWTNTGLFGAHGDFHVYPIAGFDYTEYTGQVVEGGTYYTYDAHSGEYLLLTYHVTYRHMITEQEANEKRLEGEPIFGYVDGQFIKLERNDNGMWLYGDKQLYSSDEFFTEHHDVWTHRHGIEGREIHAYGTKENFQPVNGHAKLFERHEVTTDPDKSIYRDALIPVTMGAKGSGYVDPSFTNAVSHIGAAGKTYVSYGMIMANSIFEANPLSELNEETERKRIIVVFTDGKPGDSASFNEEESNAALVEAAKASREYGAQIYTVGLYGETTTDYNADAQRTKKDQEDFLRGLSSNHPEVEKLDDVWQTVTYIPASQGFTLTDGGYYYTHANGKYYRLYQDSKYIGSVNGAYLYEFRWYYTNDNGQQTDVIVYPSNSKPTIGENGVMTDLNGNPVTIYRKSGTGYKNPVSDEYYLFAKEPSMLEEKFATIVRDLTTKVTNEIMMKNDAILRDILGQGLVLTANTIISVYKQPGTFIPGEKRVEWSDERILLDSLAIPGDSTDALYSGNGIEVNGVHIPYISVYNLNSVNATDPNGENYQPHTIDIVGYEYDNPEWYLNAESPNGCRLVVTITSVEARDDVVWGHAQSTNNNQSGLWLPATGTSERELLEAFVEPTTIFVERTYVLDYGKEFTLSDWYFDDADGQDANPVHVDCNISNGMNRFDPAAPNTANAIDSLYGNTKYGNVEVKNGYVTYSPTSMNWGSYDQFYIFGDTWRRTVLAQDANENGNLWNKVTVIPANNIYYEDSFITTESTTQNGIEGFTFTGSWTIIKGGDNIEHPEHVESESFGDVHGWTDSLSDDLTYTDGSVHITGQNKEMGAKAELTFTGTGIEVYTRTNEASGMVVAVLNKVTVNDDGSETAALYKSLAMDNLAMSGDYYNIPTIAFKDLPYGTYSLQLIATASISNAGGKRYEYHIDGVRIHNPLGNTDHTFQSHTIKNAYDLETFAVFTEVRDILLDYEDFNIDMPEDQPGAVFIDWVQDDQASGGENPGIGTPTYQVGTFEAYGPKNETYLSPGQAIVLNVAEGNHYYLGLKSLTGDEITVNVSGLKNSNPTSITLSHTIDLYYEVKPMDGYIVIQNGGAEGTILSITNLRTTNLSGTPERGGILQLKPEEAVAAVNEVMTYLLESPEDMTVPPTTEPEENLPFAQEYAQTNITLANTLFATVRHWLDTEDQGGENI